MPKAVQTILLDNLETILKAQFAEVEDACQKYACACKVRTATKPAQPIEKNTAEKTGCIWR